MIKQKNADWVNRKYYSEKEKSSFLNADSLTIKKIDLEKEEAIFAGSTDYTTSMLSCSCSDYSNVSNPVPCKHMFRLAKELGHYQNTKELNGIDSLPSSDIIFSLYNQGEFYPEQFAFFFDSNTNQWLFGIKNPLKVTIQKHKYHMNLMFSLEDNTTFYLKDLSSNIDLGIKELEYLPKVSEDFFIDSEYSIDNSSPTLLKHDTISGGGVRILHSLFDERQYIYRYCEMTNTTEEDSDDCLVEFRLQRVLFFKVAFATACSEIKGKNNNLDFRSSFFDAVII